MVNNITTIPRVTAYDPLYVPKLSIVTRLSLPLTSIFLSTIFFFFFFLRVVWAQPRLYHKHQYCLLNITEIRKRKRNTHMITTPFWKRQICCNTLSTNWHLLYISHFIFYIIYILCLNDILCTYLVIMTYFLTSKIGMFVHYFWIKGKKTVLVFVI